MTDHEARWLSTTDCLPRRASENSTCAVHAVHHPSVAVVYEHEVFPLYLRERLPLPSGGQPLGPGGSVLVCGTGHDNVHAATEYLLGEGPPLPVRCGPATWSLAEQAVVAYTYAKARAEVEHPPPPGERERPARRRRTA